MDITKIKNRELGDVAEYEVLAQLTALGIKAALARWNYKDSDIFIDLDGNFKRVQVKSKRKAEWPGIKGVIGKDILVFVDYHDKKENERPDFYLINAEDWKELITKLEKDFPSDVKIDKNNVPHWSPKKEGGKGYLGAGVLINARPKYIAIGNFKNNWDILKK